LLSAALGAPWKRSDRLRRAQARAVVSACGMDAALLLRSLEARGPPPARSRAPSSAPARAPPQARCRAPSRSCAAALALPLARAAPWAARWWCLCAFACCRSLLIASGWTCRPVFFFCSTSTAGTTTFICPVVCPPPRSCPLSRATWRKPTNPAPPPRSSRSSRCAPRAQKTARSGLRVSTLAPASRLASSLLGHFNPVARPRSRTA
jgi:hypothetical protein